MSPTPASAPHFIPTGPGGYPIFADGGPLPGYRDSIGYSAAFLGRRSVRDTWIAVSVLWIVWAILFLARQTFGPTRVYDAPRSERVTSSGAPVVSEQGPYDVQNGVAGGARGGHDHTVVGGGANGTTTATGLGGHRGAVGGRKTGLVSRTVDSVRDRIDRTYKLIRDLTLMLLVVVTLNSFGLGSGVAVLILAWIYVAFALIWAGLMMVIESRVIDLIMGTLQMLLLLGILIAAYVVGWDVLH
ncbi:hypothetical protein BG015_007867 [Linnemannia schmuckeri]|uniref:Uncharacterized protein n=1 Tax=Linnemannia schmuckeri TaxID=64567 RepID=A0A9P5VEM1_9FUNG|nr:hypothetical protein BG015_007867 [Linnemannia schmuckeri]